MPEPTATGPNGQKIVFRGGSWRDASTGAPVGGASRQQAPINTGVDPSVIARQQSQNLNEREFQYRQQRDATEDALKQREQAEKAAKLTEAQSDAAGTLRRTIEKIDAIEKDVTDSWTGIAGLGETGMFGAAQGNIPGTAAYSLRKDLGTIDATQVLQAMTRLKELSPTGSTGFGALSAPELELLKSSVARLDPNMDQETFVSNLEAARKVYADMLARIEGGNTPPAKSQTSPDIDALMKKYGNR